MFDTSKYVVSAVYEEQWPITTLPEICMAGRSNVGKSSFINALTNRKQLAYVGKRPGKTRLLNFFEIDEKYMLVDVPGYGYASLSGAQLEQFGKMMDVYFANRAQLKGLILLVDIRHEPTKDDCAMAAYAKYYDIPSLIIATKGDKVSRNQRPKHMKVIQKKLQLENQKLIVFSSLSKENLEEVKAAVYDLYTAKKKRSKKSDEAELAAE